MDLCLAAGFVRVRAVVAGCVRPGVRSAALEAPTGAVDGWFDCMSCPPGSTVVGSAHVDPARFWLASRLAARFGTYLMIAGTLLALAYMLDPAGDCWGTNSIALLKYLPVEIAVVAQGLFWLDARGAGGTNTNLLFLRSEERRVGKECRSRWSPYH